MLKLKCNPSRLPYRGEPTRTVRHIPDENFIADTAAFFPIEPIEKHKKTKDSPYTEKEIDTIIELHKEGMTPTKIGTIIGRNAGAIFMKIKKLTAEGRI